MAKSVPISNSFDLDRVFTHRFQRRDGARSRQKLIHALDTETWKGNIFLMADSDGRFLDDISIESVLKFLFHKKYQNSWNFFYRIGYDAEVILKLLDERLKAYRQTRTLQFRLDDYRLTYIPDKVLRISNGHHSVSFYDIAQFYKTSLEDAYSSIGEVPEWYSEMKKRRSHFSNSYYHHNRKNVRKYCIHDCVLTKHLAHYWTEQFHNAFGFYLSKWISSGYAAEKVLINNQIEIPKFDTVPYEVQKMAWSVVDHGGRFEITRRGYIGQAYMYDINSAYPYALTQIPDITKGKWTRRKSIHEDAKLGFFQILADIPDSKSVSPFPFKDKIRIFFPTGKFETRVTLHELKACDSKFYKILDSYQFIPNRETIGDIKPYKKFIDELYRKRLELKKKNNPMEKPIKLILNSIYGKTGQKTNGMMGNLYNPVIFISITGIIRAALYQFIMEKKIERDVVAFATDSVMTRRKIDVDSEALGEFSFEKQASDCYLLQNGYYRMNGEWKNRGIASMNGKTIKHLDTYVKNGKLFLKIQESRSTRLRSGIILDRIHDIGNIKPTIRWVDPNADRKRFWLGRIDRIDYSYNDSMPIPMNYFNQV